MFMRFEARRNANYLRTVLIIAGAFSVFTVLSFIVGGPATGQMMLIVSGVLLIYFSFTQGKIGWWYEIDETSVVVKRTLKRYIVRGTSIQKVTKVGWSGVWERIRRYRAGERSDSSESLMVALGRYIGFSAVSIPIRGRQPSGREEFIILTLKGGREYVLSPADPGLFLKECQRMISRSGRE